MNYKRNITIFLCLVFLIGCAGKTTTNTIQPITQTSTEAMLFKAVEVSFSAYDLGMSSLRVLQVTKVITIEQFNSIKTKYAWPVYKYIVVAESLAQEYSLAPSEAKNTLYEKALVALQAITVNQTEFTLAVQSIKGVK